MEKYGAIVIGLGVMGSASVYQLAKSGLKVLGIDQFVPPHVYGSSHGETRITRQSIAEGREYVPRVARANEIWKEIEAETGQKLFTQTDILIMASNAADKPNKFVDTTIAAAEEYGIEHSGLTADDIKKRFPQFNTQGGEKGYFENGAGFLRAEACIEAQLELAKNYGAELHTGENPDGGVLSIDLSEAPSLELPEHYCHGTEVAGPDGYSIELLAYGIEKAGILPADEFIGAFIASRNIATRSEGLRAIARSINKLEPGLYAELRGLEYSCENWQHALGRVHGAVTR